MTKKNENKKEAGICPFLKTRTPVIALNFFSLL